MREKGRLTQQSGTDASPFEEDAEPRVLGWVYGAAAAAGDPLVLPHGAGSDCQAPLLAGVASAFAKAGFTVLCCDLPYRQKRPHGPPFPGEAAQDRAGLRNAVRALRKLAKIDAPRRIFLGGHSYGGRQATMLAAEDGGVADGLLLLSYPLHPPRQPAQLRTAHFPALRTPAVFVQGTRDPFGAMEEMQAAVKLTPARTLLLPFEGAGHDLSFWRKAPRAADRAGGGSGGGLGGVRGVFGQAGS